MKGTIVNFRMGRHVQHPKHVIIKLEGIENREQAKEFIGKDVKWQTPSKNENFIKGKVSNMHGNSGAIRALMETGLPGQAIGGSIEFL